MGDVGDEYTPTTEEMHEWVAMVDGIAGHRGLSLGRFKRWLAARDAQRDQEAEARGAERERAAILALIEDQAAACREHANIDGAKQLQAVANAVMTDAHVARGESGGVV